MRKLFPSDGLGAWKTNVAYSCFFFAANTGMRRGEVMALKWQNIDFDQGTIDVLEAWKKKRGTKGEPKWCSLRSLPMTKALSQRLIKFKGVAHNTDPDDNVFCNAEI
jgi:integrase